MGDEHSAAGGLPSEVIRSKWGSAVRHILDVSCGIGTQSIGLAARGFQVTASDLSPQAVARAKKEAEVRGLNIRFSVCDMRKIEAHHGGGFDAVLSADNSVPHLLSDEEILSALRAMYACLRPEGGCVITLRAYDKEERGKCLVKPYGVREKATNGISCGRCGISKASSMSSLCI